MDHSAISRTIWDAFELRYLEQGSWLESKWKRRSDEDLWGTQGRP